MEEPFLINPPKSLRVRKHSRVRGKGLGREGSLHRPRVYVESGRWKTSSQARKVKPDLFLNPVGETLITVGGNPMRYFMSHRRRNPGVVASGLKGALKVQSWAPFALTGALSATATAAIPPMIGLTNEWANYGVKIAIAFVGGMSVGRFVGAEHGKVWAVVGTSLVAYDILKKYVLAQFFPQLALAGVGYQYPGYSEEGDSQVNAFPNTVSAYPDEGGVQAFPLGEVGSYPYDGSYGSYYTRT